MFSSGTNAQIAARKARSREATKKGFVRRSAAEKSRNSKEATWHPFRKILRTIKNRAQDPEAAEAALDDLKGLLVCFDEPQLEGFVAKLDSAIHVRIYQKLCTHPMLKSHSTEGGDLNLSFQHPAGLQAVISASMEHGVRARMVIPKRNVRTPEFRDIVADLITAIQVEMYDAE